MGFYEDQLLPRGIDLVLRGGQIEKVRARAAAELSGDVLEVGFGSGRNVPYYPSEVRRVRAVDPATVGRKMAAERVDASTVPVEYVGLDGQALPIESASVDHILITWTLCTIPDVTAALHEMHRVLRAGGQLHFAEHGLSPDEGVARWQHRLTPLQRRLFGGCHLNRPIDHLVSDADFTMSRLDTFYLKGPKFFGYMYEGVATKA
jgi:ubiquinone/menaquinone biosynthesis C-methylase UbiE